MLCVHKPSRPQLSPDHTKKDNAIHCYVLLLILMNLYLLCSLITTAVILSFNNPEIIYLIMAGQRKNSEVAGRKIKLQFKQHQTGDHRETKQQNPIHACKQSKLSEFFLNVGLIYGFV